MLRNVIPERILRFPHILIARHKGYMAVRPYMARVYRAIQAIGKHSYVTANGNDIDCCTPIVTARSD
jgi:hypothetical protein